MLKGATQSGGSVCDWIIPYEPTAFKWKFIFCFWSSDWLWSHCRKVLQSLQFNHGIGVQYMISLACLTPRQGNYNLRSIQTVSESILNWDSELRAAWYWRIFNECSFRLRLVADFRHNKTFEIKRSLPQICLLMLKAKRTISAMLSVFLRLLLALAVFLSKFTSLVYWFG